MVDIWCSEEPENRTMQDCGPDMGSLLVTAYIIDQEKVSTVLEDPYNVPRFLQNLRRWRRDRDYKGRVNTAPGFVASEWNNFIIL